jgi:hypothetical protein
VQKLRSTCGSSGLRDVWAPTGVGRPPPGKEQHGMELLSKKHLVDNHTRAGVRSSFSYRSNLPKGRNLSGGGGGGRDEERTKTHTAAIAITKQANHTAANATPRQADHTSTAIGTNSTHHPLYGRVDLLDDLRQHEQPLVLGQREHGVAQGGALALSRPEE